MVNLITFDPFGSRGTYVHEIENGDVISALELEGEMLN